MTKITTIQDLSAFIKSERERQGLTLYNLQKRTGLKWDTVKSVEEGEGYRTKSALDVLKALGCEIEVTSQRATSPETNP